MVRDRAHQILRSPSHRSDAAISRLIRSLTNRRVVPSGSQILFQDNFSDIEHMVLVGALIGLPEKILDGRISNLMSICI